MIRVWAERIDPVFGTVETGPITDFSITIESVPETPHSLSNLRLLNETGVDTTDTITSDPTVTGTLTGERPVAHVTVEIDTDGDGAADSQTITDEQGDFAFTPFGLAFGTHSIAVRVLKYDHSTSQLTPEPWSSTEFTLVESTELAPVVTELSLLSDSGVRGDGATENPALVGQLADDGFVDGVTIEVDLDNDGIADQTVFTDANGRFRIDPERISFGLVTIAIRTIKFDSHSSSNIVGSWSSASFTYEDQPDEPPKLFDYSFDTGSTATGIDPTCREPSLRSKR